MTNEEAIIIFQNMQGAIKCGSTIPSVAYVSESCELAIQALSENQKIRELFYTANDADDFWHSVRILFEGE